MIGGPPISAIRREHVLAALADLDAGVSHTFGSPTKFELIFHGRRYAPKAVVGIAYGKLTGHTLGPADFSSGEASGHAVAILRGLGFDVVEKGERGEDWTRYEVELIVADYFDMLRAELIGTPYNKTEHRNRLRQMIPNRSNGSVEFKHANISAVLLSLGQPYINGYKPRPNTQALLEDVVEAYLDAHSGIFADPVIAARLEPEDAPVVAVASAAAIFDTPPEGDAVPLMPEPWKSRRGRRVDYAERDAKNRKLGKLGEEFAFNLERRRLSEAGRDDLAGRTVWASKDYGDGLGYDVLSYNEQDNSERWIEVKTTALGKFFPFLVTLNEVRCSEAEPMKYRLYRVFEFGHAPRVFVLPGPLSRACQLEAVAFRAGPPFCAESGSST